MQGNRAYMFRIFDRVKSGAECVYYLAREGDVAVQNQLTFHNSSGFSVETKLQPKEDDVGSFACVNKNYIDTLACVALVGTTFQRFFRDFLMVMVMVYDDQHHISYSCQPSLQLTAAECKVYPNFVLSRCRTENEQRVHE